MKQLITVIMLVISVSVMAQKRGLRHDRIKALKVAFITEQLSLTENEAQKFWPIYNAYDENTSKIKFHDMRKLRQEIKNGTGSLSEAEANDMLDRFMEAEEKLHNQRIQLVKKLKGVIPSVKIILLKKAEDEFNRKMLEQFKKRRRNKP